MTVAMSWMCTVAFLSASASALPQSFFVRSEVKALGGFKGDSGSRVTKEPLEFGGCGSFGRPSGIWALEGFGFRG